MFSCKFAPQGWASCNGAFLPIRAYPGLFSVIGTTYGGNGSTTFALPNLAALVAMHFGAGPGLTPRVIGQTGGEPVVMLNADQLAVHSHAVTASTQGGSDSPKGNAWGLATVNVYANSGTTNLAMSTDGITTAGKGKTHDNMVPFLVVGYMIALAGIYPSKPEAE